MEAIRTYYTLHSYGRLVKSGLSRDNLIANLYRAWSEGIISTTPAYFTKGVGFYFDDVDVPSLVEAVNEEGIYKIGVIHKEIKY